VNKFIESIIQDQTETNTRNKFYKNNVLFIKDTNKTMINKNSQRVTKNNNKFHCKIKEQWIKKFAQSITLILITMSIIMAPNNLIISNRAKLLILTWRNRQWIYTVEIAVRRIWPVNLFFSLLMFLSILTLYKINRGFRLMIFIKK